MAQFNENIRLVAPNPLDERYLSTRTSGGSQLPYSATTEVFTTITSPNRYVGLTVNVNGTEYWFKNSIADGDLEEKKYDSTIPSGDFITGATNIGFFSGFTGIQTLPIDNLVDNNYDGNYDSLYNYYFRGVDGKIHTDQASDGIYRRGYYNTIKNKSWIWNEYIADNGNLKGWIFIDGNVESQIGTFQSVFGGAVYYNGTTTFPYTNNSWTTGEDYNNASRAVINTVIGSLTTGSTLTIGGPVFQSKDVNHLHFRTLKSETPELLGVNYDESFVYLSGKTATALNVGTGTPVYVSSTGNPLEFRTLVGSGDTTISTVGDNIIFYTSIDGQVSITGGTNIGLPETSGGTSVFAGNDNKTMQFRNIVGSGDTTVSLSGDTVVVHTIGGGGGVNGSVFITDMTPQSSGNVGAKVFSSNNVVLDECTTDTQLVVVSVLALPGNTNYNPVVRINGVQVILTPQSDAPLFRGTINIDLLNATGLTVIHEDGAEHSIVIVQDTPPQVLAANFTGGYPSTQTELKENDTFDFYVESDVPIINIQLDNFEAYKLMTSGVTSGTAHTITGIIANRGNTAQDQRGRVRVQKSTGGWSDWFTTTIGVDGTDHVVLNDLHPTITFGTITYPTLQSALKNSETATVNNTVSDFDTIMYSSPNSELSITDPEDYLLNKIVQRIAGSYNITANNLRIVANRAANNATTTNNTVVWIAHDDQVITVTSPARLRSGGNDGTSGTPANYTHTITIGSTQRLASLPTLVAPVGNWQNAGFTGNVGFTSFTRPLQILDSMAKGTYSWGTLSTTNLAGKVVSTITTGTQYELGGFVSRQIPLAAFAFEAQMNVEAVTYSKVVLSWDFEPTVVNRQPIGTTKPPDVTNGWSLNALNVNPTIIRILDNKTNASSQASIITIQEGI
jgi:hypothetical protein